MSQLWHQLMIRDSNNLSGESVHTFMKLLGEITRPRNVAISDIIGAVFGLQSFDGSILPWSQFLTTVQDATQFDWAWFFLFTGTPPDDADEEKLLERADVSVRLVDSGYFYVYASDSRIVKRLIESLGSVKCEIKTGSLTDLDRPY